jgi:response regulator RpfG family c-di-GMP phosphodiesterase/tRNA A-37 threonylcarbamoyl transferase component Bud32
MDSSTPIIKQDRPSTRIIVPSTTPPGHQLLQRILDAKLILPDELEGLPTEALAALESDASRESVLRILRSQNLLTDYQLNRIKSGALHGLMLGNYRLLDRLGVGGMGTVYRAEHILMRRKVAIKVLQNSLQDDPIVLERFFAEMRAVANMNHPNIVAALDAGFAANEDSASVYFLVMELIAGQDLEDFVRAKKPQRQKACELVYQVASALAEAHKNNLIHRDLKPSNILITESSQAKLLDFGLARQFANTRLTEPGTILGTLDYMAPEQAIDSSTVDIRADIYGLGATLFFCLASRPPFSTQGTLTQQITQRQNGQVPSVRKVKPDVPEELDAVVRRMMAIRPDDRFPNPQAVMHALLPFLQPNPSATIAAPAKIVLPAEPKTTASAKARVLIVDDESSIREICRYYFKVEGLECHEAEDGSEAVEILRSEVFDLVLLDVDMEIMGGFETLAELRKNPPYPNLKIIMMSGGASGDEMAKMLAAGANDFLAKPLSRIQTVNRVKMHLEQREAQERNDQLRKHLHAMNVELERALNARNSDLIDSRNALVFSLAKLVESRSSETSGHLLRIQKFCVALAQGAAKTPKFAPQIDENFVRMLECCSPLHDIGNVALPDNILMNATKLDAEERLVMQSHTTIGADTLQAVASRHGSAVAFLQMAIDIARHHHERYDGNGYPDRLAGDQIPLAARIMAIADVYDALRCKVKYRPPMSHMAAMEMVLEGSKGQFDPNLLDVLRAVGSEFEAIFAEFPDVRAY